MRVRQITNKAISEGAHSLENHPLVKRDSNGTASCLSIHEDVQVVIQLRTFLGKVMQDPDPMGPAAPQPFFGDVIQGAVTLDRSNLRLLLSRHHHPPQIESL